MSIGRELTKTELSVLHLIADEVRQRGKAQALSYLAMDPAWREIVDAILGVDEAPESGEEDEQTSPLDDLFGDLFQGAGNGSSNAGCNGGSNGSKGGLNG